MNSHLRDLKKSANHTFCAITYSTKDRVARNWSCKMRRNARVAEGFRVVMKLDPVAVTCPICDGKLVCSPKPASGPEPACRLEPACRTEPVCRREPACRPKPVCGSEPVCRPKLGCGPTSVTLVPVMPIFRVVAALPNKLVIITAATAPTPTVITPPAAVEPGLVNSWV